MRIALIQQHATRAKRVNVERGLEALRRAADDGAEWACFAELGFEWFHPQQPALPKVAGLAETVPGPTAEAFCAVARERSLVVVLNLYGGIDWFLLRVCRNRLTRRGPRFSAGRKP